MKKVPFFILLGIIAIVFLLWQLFGGVKSWGFKVAPFNTTTGVTVTGTVVSANDVKVSSSVSGEITEIKFKEGDYVKKGTILAIIDQKESEKNLEALRQDYESAKYDYENLVTSPRFQEEEISKFKVQQQHENLRIAKEELRKAKIRLADTQSKMKRYQLLYKEGAVSFRDYEEIKADYDQKLSDIDIAKDQIKRVRFQMNEAMSSLSLTSEGTTKEALLSAKSKMNAAQKRVEGAEAALSSYYIRAPFDGYVVKRLMNIGEVVSNGSAIVRMASLNDLYIKCLVEENELNMVKKGQKALVVFDAYLNDIYESTVFKTIKDVDPDSGTFIAKVKIPKMPYKVVTGMTCDVTIIVEGEKGKLVIPKDFIKSDDGKTYIFKFLRGRAIKTEVKVKEFDNNKSIVQSGLKKDDIILKPISERKLKGGEKVKVDKYYEF